MYFKEIDPYPIYLVSIIYIICTSIMFKLKEVHGTEVDQVEDDENELVQ